MYYNDKRYNLFISHAWKYDEQYKTVVSWLDASGLRYHNYSVPKEDPLHSGRKAQLRMDLTNQIKPTSCVIIIAGMYDAYSEWIQYEIDEAVRMGKYIIALRPWGAQRMPSVVQTYANVIVGWNSASLINAIKETL